MRRINRALKLLLDIVGSILLIILTAPFLLLLICIIKLETRGSAFFIQDRLGYKGNVFKIIKFRTMVNKAEQMGTGIFTNEQDPRITRVGHILRKLSLDELPQLFNIIKGEMSFVGPRPPVPYHPRKYRDYDDEQKLRFTFRPGITGYAQVKGRNSLSWDQRIEYDVLYVKKFNVMMDIKILFLTVWSLLAKENIYREKQP
ncbi:MAG: sugar transferase [bacterium]|nr:sugar transferase [bacterium]